MVSQPEIFYYEKAFASNTSQTVRTQNDGRFCIKNALFRTSIEISSWVVSNQSLPRTLSRYWTLTTTTSCSMYLKPVYMAFWPPENFPPWIQNITGRRVAGSVPFSSNLSWPKKLVNSQTLGDRRHFFLTLGVAILTVRQSSIPFFWTHAGFMSQVSWTSSSG